MKGMSIVVKTVCHWLTGFIFLYGIYIVLYGDVTPGGGFAGGVILSCSFVLMMLGCGEEWAVRWFPRKVAWTLPSAGGLVFLATALLGIAFGGAFFVNFIRGQAPAEAIHVLSAGTILVCGIAIAIEVCALLFLTVSILSVLRVVGGGSEADFVSEEEE